ncbi:MAG: YfjI family protein [Candidatus Rokuibacteriota bacterium]
MKPPKVGADDHLATGGDVAGLPSAPLGWPPPQPLPTGLPPVPAFPAALLPTAFAPWVEDIAERAQCPIDFVAVAAVVAAGAIVGRRVAIRPKRHDDWAVVPNVWGLVIGPPGIMKTPAVSEALRPLQRLVAQARETYDEQLAAHRFAEHKAKAERELLQARLKQALKLGTGTEDLEAAFRALELDPPTERRYLVNDATVEKLGELLRENPNGLLLHRDELGGFLRTMDREGHENDRAFYNEAWNGTGSYTYDRIGRGTVRIEAACISLLGGLQPGPLVAYLRETFGHGKNDDGLIQRVQLMVWPDRGGAWRNVDRWPDTTAKTAAFEIFRRLAHMDAADIGAHREGALPFLRFTPEGQAVFDAWRDRLEAQLRAPDEHPVVVSHLAKYRSLMPALALLGHLIDHGVGPIDVAAAERAVAWCAYLQPHARRVYQSVTAGPQVAAVTLGAKLQAGQLPSPFRARAIVLKGWSGLTEPDEVTGALDVLEEYRWVRRVERPSTTRGGRPTVEHEINPKALNGSVGFVGPSHGVSEPERAGSVGFVGDSGGVSVAAPSRARARDRHVNKIPPPPPPPENAEPGDTQGDPLTKPTKPDGVDQVSDIFDPHPAKPEKALPW